MRRLGYVKVWRQLEESEIWGDHKGVCVFLYLLFEACYEPTEMHGVQLQAGELVMEQARARKRSEFSKKLLMVEVETQTFI